MAIVDAQTKYKPFLFAILFLTISFSLGLFTLLFAGSTAVVSAEICTHALSSWEPIANIPVARVEGQSGVVDGKLYALGGFYGAWQRTKRVDIYDPNTNTWTRGADMPIETTHGSFTVVDEEIWVVGGFNNYDTVTAGWYVTNKVYIYNTQTDTWRQGPDLPGRRAAGVLALIGRNLHYIGGTMEDRRTDSPDHWVLNVDNEAAGWIPSVPYPRPRNHAAYGVVDGKIVIAGGLFSHDGPTNGQDLTIVDIFDPATNTWQIGVDMSYWRSHHEPGSFGLNDKLIMVGGSNLPGNGGLNRVTEYDPVLGTTREVRQYPAWNRSPIAKVIGDYLYVVSGVLRDTRGWRSRITYTCVPDGTTTGGTTGGTTTGGTTGGTTTGDTTTGGTTTGGTTGGTTTGGTTGGTTTGGTTTGGTTTGGTTTGGTTGGTTTGGTTGGTTGDTTGGTTTGGTTTGGTTTGGTTTGGTTGGTTTGGTTTGGTTGDTTGGTTTSGTTGGTTTGGTTSGTTTGGTTTGGTTGGTTTGDTTSGTTTGDTTGGTTTSGTTTGGTTTGGTTTGGTTGGTTTGGTTSGTTTGDTTIDEPLQVVQDSQFSAFDPFVTKIAEPPFAIPGELVTFVFYIQNSGDTPAQNVRAVDPIPPQVEILGASAPSGAISIQGQDVIFEQATLAPGEQVAVTIRTRVRPTVAMPFVIVNQACAEANNGELSGCGSARVISATTLPTTGERPYWAMLLAGGLVCLVAGGLAWFLRRAQ